jgi:FAD/FMN-containing dehydrogenase
MEQRNTPTALEETAVQNFVSCLRGRLLRPDDVDYEQARRVHNAMVDKRPALIVRGRDVADVIAAVNFAREHQLTLAVRGGGHNGPGLGTCDDGLVIDLSGMRGIRVDPQARTVRVEGGCTWGEVDHATHPFGLATPSGFISTTGVGGLTLGGGVGYLSRSLGLTIDNLLGVDMVLADGSFVTANATEHPDLFWAVRGGGGNFGVVTSFLFQLHPVSMVYGGPMPWPVLQSLFDPLLPPGLQFYWRSDFVTDLSERAIELHVKYGAQLPTMLSTMHLYPINGAAHRVGASETAFGFREANFVQMISGVDPDPANNERMIGWARDYWMALHPYSAGGSYVNMMMDEGTNSVQEAYRNNYARLAQIKATYDPSNLFHVNQNIKPAR